MLAYDLQQLGITMNLLQRVECCSDTTESVHLHLQIAPDFFEYFEATSPLLDKDPSLWCISAWNDHAQPGRALNSTALYRTDIIPGLGWMINRKHGLKVRGCPHTFL